MESKKLQQMQQANSHLAPMPQSKGQQYHQPPRSPVFQNHPQYQSLASNFAQISHQHQMLAAGQQPQNYGAYGQHTMNHYHGEQIYQSAPVDRERLYQAAAPPPRNMYPAAHQHPHPPTRIEQQYQALQQEKMQIQMQTQNDALMHQQQTFAMRQQLNPPPIPMQPHFHLQQPNNQQQQNQRNAPPSSLNLTNHFQPAQGPIKMSNHNQNQKNDNLYGTSQQQQQQQQMAMRQQQIYQQQKQMIHNKLQNNMQSPPQNQIIIQQNIPGQVVNQAVQTQIAGVSHKNQNLQQQQSQKTPTTTDSSPTHEPLERRKSGPVHTLKSPVTKRPVNAPVSMSGWLYKQGSEGLKVWRKRWFVLTEYCLFYYKGPEEEKLLGSVLLPSYRISACFPEDKIYRKYAFKCEHLNMRTYWFAAETAESMAQWVRALTLATMMQGSSESESQPSISSPLNQSGGDNSDSGVHTYQSQQSKHGIPPCPVTPASDNGVSVVIIGHTNGPQPLYANAPPKPRRATDGGYSSPSPEHSIDAAQQNIYSQNQTKSPVPPVDPIYDSRLNRQMTKSPDAAILAQRMMQQVRLDNNKSPAMPRQQMQSPYTDQIYGDREKLEREIYMQKLMQQHQMQQRATGQFPNMERRTPDTYGPPRDQRRHFSDYEDIYNLSHQQQQQQIPQGDVGSYRRPLSPVRYNNNNTQNPNSMPMRYTPNYVEPPASQHVQMRARPAQSLVPRPHSADFLEYESRNPTTTRMKAEPARAPRPKSSLDINRAPDNYYYSEASYAEKMRLQSASYLQQQKPSTMPMSGSKSSRTPSDEQENIEDQGSSQSVPRVHRTVNSVKGYPSQQEQFLRSASARLPKKEEEATSPSTFKDGERKREESMKRLLEWKQRMLQSPLTRKINQQLSVTPTGTISSPKSVLLQNNPTASGQLQRSRSESHTNAEYNSYSSDDEASISVRNVKNIPQVHLTVKPDPSDQVMNETNPFNSNNPFINPTTPNYYSNGYEQENYIKPEVKFETTHDLYSQAQMQRNQELINRAYMMNGGQLNNGWDVPQQQPFPPMRKAGSQRELQSSNIDRERENAMIYRNLNMSAGDLLNHTHEELVLLLIQLRRQNATTARKIEQHCTEIHDVQNMIRTSDGQARVENLSRLEQLKLQLAELEKQYEKSKPMVNLVDNMVKLGSLYKVPGKNATYSSESVTLDRLEFNQRVQERRLLQEEQRQWDRLSPNHSELQTKVQQLYQIDQLLQEESGTLQSLQRDKEDLERALGGLRAKMASEKAPPIQMEAARRQQHTLERELSRVHLLLAENSKKLEQTVASNARLEQELLVLRQKLQASRENRGSQSVLTNSEYGGTGATQVLESELRRVQQLVGDMQRQRQELSQAVRQLTENSNSLYQQMNKNGELTSSSSHIKKRTHLTSWVETDLDSTSSLDPLHPLLALKNNDSGNSASSYFTDSTNIINCSTSSKLSDFERENEEKYFHCQQESTDNTIESSGMESDDLLEGSVFGNLNGQDKQEIKTVRIVKRESERRQRDRERTERENFVSNQNLDQVVEEEQSPEQYTSYKSSKSLPRQYETHELFKQTVTSNAVTDISTLTPNYSAINYTDYYSSIASNANSYPVSMIDRKADLYTEYEASQLVKSTPSSYDHSSSGLRNKTDNNIRSSVCGLTKTIGELNPIFQSEAAKQIIHEMHNGPATTSESKAKHEQNKQRRAVPKEKRRHHTAPHHLIAKSMQAIQSENDMNKNNVNWRARDDLDMEVALRPRVNAPDIVRSAMGQRDKISENTIDKLLAAPSKILIPERYVPEQPPELSPEEKKRRQEKVEAIKKMLSESSGNDSISHHHPPSQEKKQREHLLQLNQILAQQVMQMSKIVAGNPCQSNQK